MKTKLVLLLFGTLLLVACKPVNDLTENAVYFTDSQMSMSKKITIDDTGASTVLFSRLGRSISSDLKVFYGVNEGLIDVYNKQNGTNYKVLPAEYYAIPNEAVIIAGEVSSIPVELIVKPLTGLSESEKYAIPLEIQNVEGGVDILKGSSQLVIVLDQIIVTSVPFWGSGMGGLLLTPPQPIEAPAWTLEWNLNLTKYNRNNVTLFQVKGSVSELYTRFGDKICEPNQFQGKIGKNIPQSVARFTENKWYHMALTYDGTNVRLYVDGILDFSTPHTIPGEVFKFATIAFGNNGGTPLNGYANEVRVWTVCRSQAEILNNMHVVSPESNGLQIYWKCNEGTGKKIKDHTKNQYDVEFSSDPKWKLGQRFPDDGK